MESAFYVQLIKMQWETKDSVDQLYVSDPLNLANLAFVT